MLPNAPPAIVAIENARLLSDYAKAHSQRQRDQMLGIGFFPSRSREMIAAFLAARAKICLTCTCLHRPRLRLYGRLPGYPE